MAISMLVVDDEPQIQAFFKRALDEEKYSVTIAGDVKSAQKELTQKIFQVAMIDLMLPDATGLDLLQYIRLLQPECRAIIMTGYGTTKTTVRAIQSGAFDYIEKPFGSINNILALIEKAVNYNTTNSETSEWNSILHCADQVGMVIGSSKEIKQLAATAYKIADKKVSVLITGETGTGKEVLARFIHAASNRSNNIFIPVNCGAIHENLLESELFGHEKGAFTGATMTRKGIFELADKGTLFLDELAEASHAIQVKLLRVLETGEFIRLGGERPIKTDVRIIAATNANIEKQVRDKKFREDLFYRLDVVRMELLPLRQRVTDIQDLVNYFIQKSTRHMHMVKTPVFSDKALKILMSYPWQGNIRELYNIIQQIVARGVPEIIDISHLPQKIIYNANGKSPEHDANQFKKEEHLLTMLEKISERLDVFSDVPAKREEFKPRTLEEVEQEHINQTLVYFNGNISLAAKALGLSRATLHRKIKQ